MDINKFKIIVTPTAYREINKIYEYILYELDSRNAAKKLMEEIENKVQSLKYSPKIHSVISKVDELKRQYRRIVVKNYIILYTIDEEKREVFISHIYFGGRDYLGSHLL